MRWGTTMYQPGPVMGCTAILARPAAPPGWYPGLPGTAGQCRWPGPVTSQYARYTRP